MSPRIHLEPNAPEGGLSRVCGIAGYISFAGSPASRAVLAGMTDAQRHRGPDDQGLRLFSLKAGVSLEVTTPSSALADGFEGGLGFNRLSILDLSVLGHQPMLSADEKVLLAFNGEIYNAFDYTRELEGAGFGFRSRTDTEVVLNLYQQFGLDGMLERLNGMFALAIVDLRSREIHVARDHFGVKPMYWTVAGESLLFASEIKSFLQHPGFRAEIDNDYVDEYLSFRAVCGENTLLKGVRELRPGHCLRVTTDGVSVRRYWQIPDREEGPQRSESDTIDELDHLLRRSVESQLLSDVKVGSQLSGGIDSSLVSLYARARCNANLDTFSVIFDDPSFSEESWMSQAAAVAGVEMHKFTFDQKFFFETLARASWHLDQPLTHPNSLGIWLLSAKARPFVTVLLSGEGADEVFGGYTRFYYAGLRPRVSPWLPLLRLLPAVGQRLERQFGGDPIYAFICASMFQRPDELLRIRPEADFEQVMLRRRALFAEGHGDHLGNCLKYEMQTYLVDLLVRQDKMTMAHSMENRVPFLDRSLVAFSRALPSRMLVSESIALKNSRMRGTKVALKKLARRYFDDDFVYRPKSGFSLPLAQYFVDKRFESLMEDELLPGMAQRGLVDAKAVRRGWKATATASQGASEATWIAVALEQWAQVFVDPSREAVNV